MAVLAPVGSVLRSQLRLRAVARCGRTVLEVVAGHGQMVARQTGEGRVHLVGQAAGPLNGDELELVVDVGPGARLVVATTAATIALPGAGRDPASASRIRLAATVGADAELVWIPEPLVVASGARLLTDTRLAIAASGRVRFREAVVLGRHGEDGGQVRSRLRVERGGAAVLSQTLDSAIADRTGRWTGRAERVLATGLQVRPQPWPAPAVVAGGAVAMQPAPGVLLASATGDQHRTAAAALAEVMGD